MRVGLIDFPVGGRPGPAGPWAVRNLAAALAELGHQVRLMGEGRRGAATDSTGVEQVGSHVRQLSRELESGRYDVLHSHGWLAGLTCALATRGTGVPFVHTFDRSHLTSPRPDAPATEVRAERLSATHAAHLLVGSEPECDALVRAGIPRRRVSVVPRGVELVEPPPGPARPAAAGQRLVVFGDRARVLMLVGVLRGVPAAELVVALPPEHPLDVEEIRAAADRAGVADRVAVEPVPTAASRAALIRGAVAVLCMTPNSDPGTSHLEAMTMGVPVVAGNAVAAEAVVDGITGFHAPDDPRRLAGSLRTLLNDPIRREGMGMAGRDRALMRYSWTRVAGEIGQIYRQVAPAAADAAPPVIPAPTGANPASGGNPASGADPGGGAPQVTRDEAGPGAAGGLTESEAAPSPG